MKRYVARISNNLGKLHEYILSKSFDSIEECQNFIKTNCALIAIEFFLQNAFKEVLTHYFVKDKPQCSFCFGGSFVRVYDLKLGRFIDSFDF